MLEALCLYLCFDLSAIDFDHNGTQRLRHALAGCGGDHQRCVFRRAFEPPELLFELRRRQRVSFIQRHDLRFFGEPMSVRFELGPHGRIGVPGMFASSVDQMQQHAAALDMPQESVA